MASSSCIALWPLARRIALRSQKPEHEEQARRPPPAGRRSARGGRAARPPRPRGPRGPARRRRAPSNADRQPAGGAGGDHDGERLHHLDRAGAEHGQQQDDGRRGLTGFPAAGGALPAVGTVTWHVLLRSPRPGGGAGRRCLRLGHGRPRPAIRGRGVGKTMQPEASSREPDGSPRSTRARMEARDLAAAGQRPPRARSRGPGRPRRSPGRPAGARRRRARRAAPRWGGP